MIGPINAVDSTTQKPGGDAAFPGP